MKKIILLSAIFLIAISCSDGSGGCSYKGHTLYVGEKGGCYYVNSSGNKEYVDKKNCSSCY
ncbi:hypothetical protein [Chryseobacterium taichungense]|uniref:Lipoprotein n=1 Tax=Chryseobacterium taichungense TaxID=295069 RepID=A0A1H7W2N8_9FLAO|nr:hypothetical protein [Chryseobacterium taichungense]SEM15379.1 hypothetical protein SAMN05421856_101428 [Chryseobacterium taichungense]